MSTHANVTIEGKSFHVSSDGWNKEGILDIVKDYVKDLKPKVKQTYLSELVVDSIAADSASDYYAPFRFGYCDQSDYAWSIKIGQRGGVKIKGGKIGMK